MSGVAPPRQLRVQGHIIDMINNFSAPFNSPLFVVKHNKIVYANQCFFDIFGNNLEYWLDRNLPEVKLAIKNGLYKNKPEFNDDVNIINYEWLEELLPGDRTIYIGIKKDYQNNSPQIDPSKGREVLFASVTHEMRTPLSGVLGATDLLLDSNLDSNQRSFIKLIKSGAEHTLNIIDEILDLARIEAGDFFLRSEPVNIRRLLEDSIELLAFKSSQKDLTLDYVIEDTVPLTIESDNTRLKQIIFNLVGNAIKYTDAGGVVLLVDYVEGALVLNIIDTGRGISESDQKNLFVPFERGAAERSATPGAGLGLAIVDRLVKAGKGTISLQSKVGSGSNFEVVLPVQILQGAPERRAQKDLLFGILPENALQGFAIKKNINQHYKYAEIINKKSIDSFIEKDQSIIIASDKHIPFIKSNYPKKLDKIILIRKPTLLSNDDRIDGFKWLTAPIRPNSIEKVVENNIFNSPELNQKNDTIKLLKGKLILVAEDDVVSSRLLNILLQKAGAKVITVSDGIAAIKEIIDESRQIDCAILDLNMEKMGGLEAAKEIRRVGGRNGRSPLIAITASRSNIDRFKCMEAGFDEFFTKPIFGDMIVSSIQNLCSIK